MRKFLETVLCSRDLMKGINLSVVSLEKIFGTILKMDKERAQANEPENRKVDDVQSLTSES